VFCTGKCQFHFIVCFAIKATTFKGKSRVGNYALVKMTQGYKARLVHLTQQNNAIQFLEPQLDDRKE
jgi:hypothetical protein